MNIIKNQKQYMEKYILPNESKEIILDYHNGSLDYDIDYLKEHIKYNKELTKENKKELINIINKNE